MQLTPIIDVHTHVETIEKNDCIKQCHTLIEDLDLAEIDYALVMSDLDEGHHPKKDNELLVEILEKFPRLFPIGCFDYDYVDESIDILEQLANQKQIAAIKFFTGYQHFLPTDEKIRPLLAYAEKNNVPVMFHTGAPAQCVVSRLKFCMNPYEIDEVCYRYPELKVSAAHFNAPHFLSLAPVLENKENLHADLSGLFEGDANPKENVYISVLNSNLKEAFCYLENIDNIMFGSDRPYLKPIEAITWIKDFFQTYKMLEGDLPDIFRNNAIRFYNLDIDNNSIKVKGGKD